MSQHFDHRADHSSQAPSAGPTSEASVLAGSSRSPARAARDHSGSSALRAQRAGWFTLGALGAGLIGALLPSANAWQGTNPPQSQAPILSAGGATSDSNNRMIAVTGLDLTGQSVLYLVDTQEMQLACYQATGGAGGTQGVRLVGARRIELDLMLDGFNDKTQDQKGNSLPFKALLKQFQASGLLDPNR